jgi:hypothetical protein
MNTLAHPPPVARQIHVYHMNTGELRLADSRDCQGLAVLQPFIGPKLGGVPDNQDWIIETKVTDSMLISVAGHKTGEPLIRICVVLDGQDLGRVVPAPRVLDLPLPVCTVELLRELPGPPMDEWLLFFAGTLASAWMHHVDEFGIGVRQAELG